MKNISYIKTSINYSRGSGLITVVIISALVVSLLGLSLSEILQTMFNGLNSSNIALQAQQYAISKAELLHVSGYNRLAAQSLMDIGSTAFADEIILGAESIAPNNIKQRNATIRVYYNSEKLPRYTLTRAFYSSAEESSGFGDWIDNFPSSGIAPTDGIITASSGFNSGLGISTGGVERVSVSARSKYGQGYVTATSPVKKGENYSVWGARYIRFLKMGN